MNVQPHDFAAPREHGTPGFRAIIIGAGMSGILMGIKLKEAGIDNFTIYEKASELGGTWRENTYPGIACDVPSHHYCYSFEPNPDWSHTHPPGSEIKAYFERVAEKYGIMSHIEFGVEVKESAWKEPKWEVTLADGRTDTGDILVAASGVLHVPSFPEIEGLASFEGATFHTAQWDHSVPLEDKRIGIIGTGSTAAQIVPAIIDKVKKLTVFQRTAQWMYPLDIKEYSTQDQERFRKNPWLMKILYQWNFFLLEQSFSKAVVGASRLSKYLLDRACRQNLARVKDPELRAKLTPDYEPGCKRLIFSTEYYDAIQKPNAALVTEDIERVEPEGIRTKDGDLHELDVLVLSTGFKPDRFVRPMVVRGEGNATLEGVWADGPRAYHSVSVPQMPNFFMIIGPYSPIGNLSLISIAEYQVRYIMKLVEKIRRQNVSLSPLESATEAERQKMREQVKKTVWVGGGCQSWYLDEKGIPIIYPWEPSVFYRSMRKDPDMDDYQVKELPAPAPMPAAAE